MQQDNNPNQQPQNPYTIDYLNQIAPKQKQPLFDKTMMIVFGVLAFAIVAFVGMMVFSSARGDSNSETLLRAYFKVQKTNELATKYQGRLQNSDLRAINSGLATTLSSDETKLKTLLDSSKIEIPKAEKNKTPPKIISQVDRDIAELDKILDDAFLNAVLDRTYAREMSYNLDVINSLLKRVESSTRSESSKTTVGEIIKSLDISSGQFREYSQSDK